MREVKVNDKLDAIVGITPEDLAGITISIVKNEVVKCEYPISIIRDVLFFYDNPIIYDKTKDKIEVVVRVDGFERRRQRLL